MCHYFSEKGGQDNEHSSYQIHDRTNLQTFDPFPLNFKFQPISAKFQISIKLR